jgi:hypothetical protein
MRLSKSLVLVAIIGMLISATAALASQGNGNPGKPKTEKSPKVDKDKKDSVPIHLVPEPATIALLGAAAGIAGARRVWQRRDRSRSE